MLNDVPTPNKDSNEAAIPRLTYSMAEAAQVLGVSYLTVHRLVQRGLLGSLPGLRHKLIPKADLERYLASGCVRARNRQPAAA